jgi:hypothetical protein
MVPAGGSRHAHSGGLQQIRVTVRRGLPSGLSGGVCCAVCIHATREVQRHGRGGRQSTMDAVIKHEDLRIVVELAAIRFTSRGKPHSYETEML